MANKEDILLELGIKFPADQFKKSYEKSFKDLERASQRASKFGQGKMGDLVDKMANKFGKGAKSIKIAEQALSRYQAQQKMTSAGIQEYKKKEGQAIKDLKAKQTELLAAASAYQSYVKAVATASAATKDQAQANADAAKQEMEKVKGEEAALAKHKAAIEDKQASLRQLFDQTRDAIEATTDDIENMKFEFSGTKLLEAATEAGKELAEPLTALFDKDIERSGKAFAKLAGKGIGGGIGLIGKGIGALGGKLTDKAASREKAGKGGLGTKAMGGVGELMKGLGPIIQTLAKIGPILGVAAGAVMSLVKLFIDADAVVKEFNKGMIEAGGSAQYFKAGMGTVTGSVNAMEGALRGARDAAYDLQGNFDWGISADTHKQVLQNLQAEGVSLTTLAADYKQLNAQSSAFSKDFGSVTQAAVAYSRHMGVSLQEVTGFQAEMMTEIGMSLGSTVESYRMMSRAADESGIKTSKFFNMIRGVSADLSLYNTRLEDAVKLLGKLGKVMSPRNAQQFMQWAMKAVKGMGRVQRLQTTLLAGPAKVAGMVTRDIADKAKSIGKEIAAATGGNAEEIEKLLASGKAEDKAKVKKMIAGIGDDSKKGTLNEAVGQLGIQQKRAGKGTYGVAQAAGSMAPVRQAAMLQAAIERFGDIGSIGAEQMAENLGVSSEQLEQMELFRQAIEDQRALLISNAKSDAERQKYAGMTMDQVYDTMSAQEKDALEKAGKEEEFNKKIGSNVQSITDKLQVLIDWFTNTFYNVMLGIWESIDELTGFGAVFTEMRDAFFALAKKFGADLEKGAVGGNSSKKAQIAAMKSGNKELTQALEGKKGAAATEALRGTEVYKQATTALFGGKGQAEALRKRAEGHESVAANESLSPELREKAAADAEAARKQAAQMEKQQKFLQDRLDTMFTDDEVSEKYGGDVDKARSAAFASLGVEGQTKLLADFAKQFPSEEMADMAKKATERGSIYTHDIHLEKLMDQMSLGEKDAAGGAIGSEMEAENLGLSQEEYEAQLAAQEESGDTLGDIYDALRQKGVRLDKSWMDNHMKKMVEEATLDALRVGLLEYYMYKDLQPQDISEALKRGVDPKALGKGLVDKAREGVLPADAIGALGGNAEGGLVTGIRGGLAQISPAPGEGLASIGRGERIVPAGGGGGSTVRVELSLKGDLAQLIDARAQQVIVQHEAAAGRR